ncbi:MAG TPA: MFS transporter [Xanthobacteraceae bacterium]|nr:MFS transporter [Xanthobacteraceae bacterium]
MTDRGFPAKPLSFALLTAAGVATLCALYTMSQFLRNSVGVIAPDLAREIQLSAAEIGFLSSAYFLMFGLAQVPLGIALDRFGPKPCLLVSVLIAVAGCVVFATASSAGGLVLGRLLMGLGTASYLMAPLALYARWFAPTQFSTMAGLHMGIGTLGALLATAPLAWSAGLIGWRATFAGIGVITFAFGALVWLIVRDVPQQAANPSRHASLRADFAGLWEVIRTPSIGRLFLVQLTNYPSFLLIVGLWGGPYLAHVYGLDLKARGDILFIPALAQVIGSVFWGPMDRVFGRYKPPVLIAVTLVLASLGLLALLGKPALPVLLVLLAVLGFSTGLTSLIMGQAKMLVPPHLLGRSFTLLNIGPMGGGFAVQFASGALINVFPSPGGVYPLEAYQLVFALQGALLLIAAIAYLGSRDSRLKD